jgi:acetamidase/formamidase
MRATVRLTARPDLHLTAPEFLTASGAAAEVPVGRRYATDGIGPDLLTAARDATRRMIDWLGREHGVAAQDAYMLCSVGVDLRISEVVDVPNYVVTAHCPLSIFE